MTRSPLHTGTGAGNGGTVDRSFLSRLAEQSDGVFSLEELEDIDGLIDDNSFRKISRQAGIRALDGEDKSWLEQEAYSIPPKKPGLLATLRRWWQECLWQVTAKRSTAGTATVIAPIARTTMDTAMDDGTMERAISTAVSLAAIKAARTEFQRFRIITAKYIESGSRSSLAPGILFCGNKTIFLIPILVKSVIKW